MPRTTKIDWTVCRYFLLILLSILIVRPAEAQDKGRAESRSIIVDTEGNTYITGDCSGKNSFSSTMLNSGANEDLFIVKYDAAGNLVWARKAGGRGKSTGVDLALDAANNLYVLGNCQDSISFGACSLVSNGGSLFIAKFDPQGNIVWVKGAARAFYNKYLFGKANSLSSDANNNIYVGISSPPFYGSDTSIKKESSSTHSISKLDTAGNVIWTKPANSLKNIAPWNTAGDALGNLYLTGVFKDSISFDGISLRSNGKFDAYLTKYDSSGKLVWAKNTGGSEYGRSQELVVDVAGNCYVIGLHTKAPYWRPEGKCINMLFISKYDALGNLLWSQSTGGNHFCHKSYCYAGLDLAADKSGNCYVTGYFQKTVNLGQFTLHSRGSRDIFIAKIDPSGNFIWARRAGGRRIDLGKYISLDTSGNIYLTGDYSGRGTFLNNTLIYEFFRPHYKHTNVFIAKYDPNGKQIWRRRAKGKR